MEVVRGTLTVKQYGIIKDKTYENHFCILYHGIQTLSPRIDMYERDSVEQNKSMVSKKTIYIEAASWRKMDAIGPTLSFMTDKGNQRYTLIFKDNAMLREWLLSLCCISHGLFTTKHVVGVNSEGVIHPSPIANDVAATPPSASSFFVLADQLEACYNLGLKGIFNMQIKNGVIKLSPITGNMTVTWNIQSLRSYGFSTQTVFIYAGSRSSTGEGRFVFRTIESKKINDAIDLEASYIGNNNTGSCSQLASLNTELPVDITTVGVPKDSASKNSETEYFNLGAGPPPLTHKTDSFKQKLDHTLENKLLPLTQTISNNSSDTNHLAQDKKALKKLEKEQKHKEKEDKKQQKLKEERDKREERRKKEAERIAVKKREKELKGMKHVKQAVQAKPLPCEPKNVCADANAINHQAGKIVQASLDGDYASAGDFIQPVQYQSNTTHQVYQDPWENKALPSPTDVQPLKTSDIDSIYAQPNKINARPKLSTNISAPSEDSSNASGSPPPIVPPTFDGDDLSGNLNIYAHTNDSSNSAIMDSSNVYGLGSASVPFVPHQKSMDDSVNVYDNI